VFALHQSVAEGGGRVGLASAGETEAQDVVSPFEELAGGELVELGDHGSRQSPPLERLEGLSR